MLRDFKKFIEEHNLIQEGDKVLLALSGGVDSIVLAKLLMLYRQRPISISFAHCNFHLRGDDSNRDEKFVTEFANKNNIPIYIKHFDTETYAKENSLSIEMAARELRYSWFKELKEVNNFDKVALAHHGDDQVETFFINLLRGSGIKGLKGMKPQNDFYIRPLLWTNRKQIEAFAKDNAIQWVEDYTNQENVYLRNKIRNQLMPFFDEIKDGARQSLKFSVDCLTSENELYRSLIDEKLSQHENVNGDYRFIENKFFLENENGRQLLFEWVRKYGFNYEQSASMFEAMRSGKSGALFYSIDNGQQTTDSRLCSCLVASVQKGKIEIFKNKEEEEEYWIYGFPDFRISGTLGLGDFETWGLRFSVFNKDVDFKLIRDVSVAQFDMEKVAFPLKLRRWRKGDRFNPIGMKGSKLLSDFFNDMGFSTYQKQNVWIMEDSNNLILWVVGYRISDKVKITDSTKVIFQCTLES
ncbi:MAG: tRNA lysidine(34) synthetase TilS [Bacteroidales bacterium]|nr:tRNA lysidine(34) synthetase TilS [Bacteroidales bacterium]